MKIVFVERDSLWGQLTASNVVTWGIKTQQGECENLICTTILNHCRTWKISKVCSIYRKFSGTPWYIHLRLKGKESESQNNQKSQNWVGPQGTSNGTSSIHWGNCCKSNEHGFCKQGLGISH